jgi:peptide/nickel transport system substrate-binding protein
MKKKLISISLALVLSIGLLSGCSNTGSTQSDASGAAATTTTDATATDGSTTTDEHTLTVALSTSFEALDPIHGYSHEIDSVLTSIAEGLFYYDFDGVVQPLIAESYTQPDATTYVYKIRDDVTFSDGTPLTVDDVIFSLERHRSTTNPSELGWMFANVDTITKTGDWEVTVKLKQADPVWQDTLATSAGLIISKTYYEAHADNFGTAEGGIIGSGPYVLSDWSAGNEIDLVANENYWNPDTTLDFTKLVFKIIPDSTVRNEALQSGQVDLVFGPPVDSIETLESDENINLSEVDAFASYFLSFNTSRKPYNDVNVRKAISYAIDKESIVENVFKGYAVSPSSLPFNASIVTADVDNKASWDAYFAKVKTYDYNLDTAKEYLAKSSVPDGFSTTLVYPADDSVQETVALAIQQNLAELNITVELIAAPWSEISIYRYGGSETRDYDLLFTGWGSDYPDPTGTIVPMYDSANIVAGGSNWAEYKNDEFDKLVDEQATAANSAERATLLQKALDIIAEDVPYIPVYNPNAIVATNKRIDYAVSSSYLYNLFYKDFKLAK